MAKRYGVYEKKDVGAKDARLYRKYIINKRKKRFDSEGSEISDSRTKNRRPKRR